MGFAFDHTNPTLAQILLDPAVQDLLETLVDALFLTPRQMGDWLWNYPGPGFLGHALTPATRIRSLHRFRKLVRFTLDLLEQSSLLGCYSVERLPPVTIGEQFLFSHDSLNKSCQLPTSDEATQFADNARRRVPPLGSHGPSKLYFARNSCCEFLDDECGGPGVRHTARDETVNEMVDRHKTAETRFNPSPVEIATTHLTAVLNVNQILLAKSITEKTKTVDRPYRATGLFGTGSPEARIRFRRETVALYFLRPILPEQICDQVEQYRSQYSDTATVAWWM